MNGSPPRVGILMGSDRDWPKIQDAAAALAEFDVAYEVRVISAPRTPEVVQQYATSARERGLQVIIAAAGRVQGGSATQGRRQGRSPATGNPWCQPESPNKPNRG